MKNNKKVIIEVKISITNIIITSYHNIIITIYNHNIYNNHRNHNKYNNNNTTYTS